MAALPSVPRILEAWRSEEVTRFSQSDAHPPPLPGEILLLDDLDTGFSSNHPKRSRPYVVIGVAAFRVRVVPQSTIGKRGVHVPGDAVDGLDEGHFVPYAATVPLGLAVMSSCLGYLPETYLQEILTQSKPWP